MKETLCEIFFFFFFRIRHNNKGGFAPWYLESIIIKDVEGKSWKHIPAQIWLKKKRKQVELDLPGLKRLKNHYEIYVKLKGRI